MLVAYIDVYMDRFGVESICRALGASLEGGFITSRGYRAAKRRPASARSVRDQTLARELLTICAHNFGVCGIGKMWHAARGSGWNVGRDQVARVMRIAGARTPVTTRQSQVVDLRPNLVKRCFKVGKPNELWVADITYVRTLSGFVYTAFVTDVFSRKIVG